MSCCQHGCARPGAHITHRAGLGARQLERRHTRGCPPAACPQLCRLIEGHRLRGKEGREGSVRCRDGCIKQGGSAACCRILVTLLRRQRHLHWPAAQRNSVSACSN